MSYGLVRGARQSLRKKKGGKQKNKLSTRDDSEDLALPASRRSDIDWEFSRGDLDELVEIGHGQFGVVYIGTAKNIVAGQAETKVAVKTLADSSPEARAEFDGEAKIMKAIDNNNVVQLLGLCTDKAPFYMIMEFMAKGDLKGFLRDNRPKRGRDTTLSLRQLAIMGAGVANGMGYLAQMHIVHRDLAARNCLVNDNLDVKVGDFGLTRKTYSRDYYRMTGSAPLPIRWMPPESFMDGVFSTASDIWAFGVMLWEIQTFGKLPYADLNNGEVAEQVSEDDYRLPSPGGCPSAIYDVMQMCWEEDGEDRGTFEGHKKTLLKLVETLDDAPVTREMLHSILESTPGADVADEDDSDAYADLDEDPGAGYDQNDFTAGYDTPDVASGSHDYGIPSSGGMQFGTSSYANPMSFVERAEGVQKTVADWIAKVTGTAVDDTDLQAALKDGQALCVLINKLKPGSVRKIHSSKHAIKQTENISHFLEGASAFGLPLEDCFQVDDLRLDDDMARVVLSLSSLKSLAEN